MNPVRTLQDKPNVIKKSIMKSTKIQPEVSVRSSNGVKKVLIIEDDQWLAENYQLILQKNNWHVKLVAQAGQAIDIIDSFQPDVILLDYLLPHKNAPTLLNELQSHPDTSTIPIILCSSLSPQYFQTTDFGQYGVKAALDKTTLTPDLLQEKLNTFVVHAAD